MLETPWKVKNHLLRLLYYPWIRAVFWLAGVPFGRRFRVFGTPLLQRHRGSRIALGAGIELRSTRASNPLTPHQPCVFATRGPHAQIVVGPDCGMTGAVIVAATSVHLGARVLVGANAVIMDTDFHPLEPVRRRAHPTWGDTAPILIEDDVFIGTQAMILKGVTIGRGAVVGARAVVTKDIPAFSIVAGNPARVIGSIPEAEARSER